jgi:hypothetical protein
MNGSELAAKSDLREIEIRIYKYFNPILVAHAVGTTALTVALLQLLK